MKKIFIGLLILAAGTVTFLLIRNQSANPGIKTTDHALLTGAWKGTMAGAQGSAPVPYYITFTGKGIALRSVTDSLPADTLHYSWSAPDKLSWQAHTADSLKAEFTVIQLTRDSLGLRAADSSSLQLVRVH